MKTKVKGKINSPEKNLLSNTLHNASSVRNWAQAAEDARVKIAFHKKKILCLEESLNTFERFAKEGVPWPGEDKQDAATN
jgi:hypothetical protein